MLGGQRAGAAARKARAGVVIAALVAVGCSSTGVGRRGALDPAATVRVRLDGRIVAVPIEHYVRTVILSEFAGIETDPRIIERMLEVQAIVSRTYALTPRHTADGFDLCSTTHCQLYQPSRVVAARWRDAADEAVRRTAGVIVWFGDSPARVAYHADCGGRTSAAQDVWEGRALSYLASVVDDDAGTAHLPWQFAPGNAPLRRALNGDDRTRVGAFLSRIDVVKRDLAGRAQLIAIDGERSPIVRGEEFRLIVGRAFGPRALRSTWFDVARTPRGFEFSGRGFGHGVGLCQAGAYARIASGAAPAEVLTHYFPGTSVH
ncbi:MAG: SpoIID/LytB domain-containing protein [Vicinamibacterales bacterium]